MESKRRHVHIKVVVSGKRSQNELLAERNLVEPLIQGVFHQVPFTVEVSQPPEQERVATPPVGCPASKELADLLGGTSSLKRREVSPRRWKESSEMTVKEVSKSAQRRARRQKAGEKAKVVSPEVAQGEQGRLQSKLPEKDQLWSLAVELQALKEVVAQLKRPDATSDQVDEMNL